MKNNKPIKSDQDINYQDPFASIRPYNDDEVKAVVKSLLRNKDLRNAITSYRFANNKYRPKLLLRFLISLGLRREVKKVKDVRSWQEVLAKYMRRMINSTIDEFTYSGMEKIKADTAYLFISNHRDIAMDPALVNWCLYQEGIETVRIALGDNLLKKSFVSDLMRLNKSFIVKRSATSIRERMKVYMQLSSYIDQSIHSGHNVWIAQREGRAKDGVDASDPAVMKMLYMSPKKSGVPYLDYIKSLHIVPVSISYELDPCDQSKAIELATLLSRGQYIKEEFEDIDSIVKGIIEHKGSVHVAFGDCLEHDIETPEALAEWLDRQIVKNYHLFDTNHAAVAMQNHQTHSHAHVLQARMQDLNEQQQAQFLTMYANPVHEKRKYEANDSTISH